VPESIQEAHEVMSDEVHGGSIRATVLQTPQPGRIDVRPDQVISWDGEGRITAMEPADRVSAAAAAGSVQTLSPNHVVIPGLIDTHVHAPQWPQLGVGLDLPLEEWLFTYTFPLEARYADIDFARRVWASMVPALLARGTTTAVYHSSTHEPATEALAQACLHHGQRAFVGRVAMDHPEGTPEWYRDSSASDAVAASARSIDAIRAIDPGSSLVQPIITPRFIPACTDAALQGLGELAEATGALVQTHCSESDWEHGYVLDRHGCTDTVSLARFGLIRDHSVLAHATHLTDDDRSLLAQTGAGVAHCPLSNSYFANAVFPVRRALDAGVRVGLGTDISGGPEPSLLTQCAHAVTSSRMLDDGVDVDRNTGDGRGRPGSRIELPTAFWMATVGGAELLGLDAGLLSPGRLFDAVAIDVSAIDTAVEDTSNIGPGLPDAADQAAWIRLLERIVRHGQTSIIDRVWVNGRQVVGD
jgi:guanine deaminase